MQFLRESRYVAVVADGKIHFLERVGNEVEAFAEGVLDDIIFRGVAKIAFNFLAHLKGADFVLRPDFDPIREYIRLGKAPRRAPVIAGPEVKGQP